MSSIPHEECRRGAHLPSLRREPVNRRRHLREMLFSVNILSFLQIK